MQQELNEGQRRVGIARQVQGKAAGIPLVRFVTNGALQHGLVQGIVGVLRREHQHLFHLVFHGQWLDAFGDLILSRLKVVQQIVQRHA